MRTNIHKMNDFKFFYAVKKLWFIGNFMHLNLKYLMVSYRDVSATPHIKHACMLIQQREWMKQPTERRRVREWVSNFSSCLSWLPCAWCVCISTTFESHFPSLRSFFSSFHRSFVYSQQQMAVITIYSRSARLSKNFSYTTHMNLYWILIHTNTITHMKKTTTTPTRAHTHLISLIKKRINKIGATNMANMK